MTLKVYSRRNKLVLTLEKATTEEIEHFKHKARKRNYKYVIEGE